MQNSVSPPTHIIILSRKYQNGTGHFLQIRMCSFLKKKNQCDNSTRFWVANDFAEPELSYVTYLKLYCVKWIDKLPDVPVKMAPKPNL